MVARDILQIWCLTLGRVADTKLGKLMDRAKARIGRIKADRSTERGVAGHQAAMMALGKSGGWERKGPRSLISVQNTGKGYGKAITPGFGHVKVNNERLGYEGIDPKGKGNN